MVKVASKYPMASLSSPTNPLMIQTLSACFSAETLLYPAPAAQTLLDLVCPAPAAQAHIQAQVHAPCELSLMRSHPLAVVAQSKDFCRGSQRLFVLSCPAITNYLLHCNMSKGTLCRKRDCKDNVFLDVWPLFLYIDQAPTYPSF